MKNKTYYIEYYYYNNPYKKVWIQDFYIVFFSENSYKEYEYNLFDLISKEKDLGICSYDPNNVIISELSFLYLIHKFK